MYQKIIEQHIMNTKLKILVFTLSTVTVFSSCVKKSRYDKVCVENYRLQEQIKSLISETSKKDLVINELKAELKNTKQQKTEQPAINTEKAPTQNVGSFLNERDCMQGTLASVKSQDVTSVKSV